MYSNSDLEILQAIKAIACRNVLSPDFPYFVRKVRRWYSEKFHVPLSEMDKIPLYDLLLNYWEAFYENLSDEHLIEESQHVVFTESELKAMAKQEEESIENILDAIKKEEELKTQKELEKTANSIGNLKDEKPGSDLDDDKMPPGFSISFVDDEETDSELPDAMAPPKVNRKNNSIL